MLPRRTLFVAVHLGPYLSVLPLARGRLQGEPLFLLDGPARQAHAADGEAGPCEGDAVEDILQEHRVQAVIVGTSEGLPAGNLEDRAVKAARQAGIPTFVIEDFPGNYSGSPRDAIQGLFVEDDWVAELHRRRGLSSEILYGLGNPRYDGLSTLPRGEIRTRVRTRLGLGEQSVILWAGQPEGANSFHALERLIPGIKKTGATLLMKAHPRDALYARGGYACLTSDLASVQDVTEDRDTIGLCCAADLVVTQFSSVGAEALYLGTPTVFALFEDLGQTYLQRHKGYGVVPWAAHGCSFLLDRVDEVTNRLDEALFDNPARAERMRKFARLYGERPASGPAIAAAISHVLDRVATPEMCTGRKDRT